MRHKIVTVVAAGALGVTGLGIAAPAIAATTAPSATAAVTDRVAKIKAALTGLVKDGSLTQSQADKVADTLGSADLGRGAGPGGPGGPGGHGGPGGRGGPDLAAAAKALKLTAADLRTALEGGKTLAQVAKDKGVAVGTLVTALVEAEKTRIAADVTAGRITQAQADERLSGVTARVTDRVNGVRPTPPKADWTATPPTADGTAT